MVELMQDRMSNTAADTPAPPKSRFGMHAVHAWFVIHDAFTIKTCAHMHGNLDMHQAMHTCYIMFLVQATWTSTATHWAEWWSSSSSWISCKDTGSLRQVVWPPQPWTTAKENKAENAGRWSRAAHSSNGSSQSTSRSTSSQSTSSQSTSMGWWRPWQTQSCHQSQGDAKRAKPPTNRQHHHHLLLCHQRHGGHPHHHRLWCRSLWCRSLWMSPSRPHLDPRPKLLHASPKRKRPRMHAWNMKLSCMRMPWS